MVPTLLVFWELEQGVYASIGFLRYLFSDFFDVQLSLSIYSVNTGFWTDHDKAPAIGATITLQHNDVNKLISTITTTIPLIVRSAVWNVTTLFLHQSHSLSEMEHLTSNNWF